MSWGSKDGGVDCPLPPAESSNEMLESEGDSTWSGTAEGGLRLDETAGLLLAAGAAGARPPPNTLPLPRTLLDMTRACRVHGQSQAGEDEMSRVWLTRLWRLGIRCSVVHGKSRVRMYLVRHWGT